MKVWFIFLSLCFASQSIVADGPKDNDPANVRPVPPIGTAASAEQEDLWLQQAAALRTELEGLSLDSVAQSMIEVYPRAVEMTLATQMVYGKKDVSAIENAITEGKRRVELAKSGKPRSQMLKSVKNTRLVTGGFRSKIDGSVQPFGLVLPADFSGNRGPYRLDVWLHGRGERVSEALFLEQRATTIGQYAPPNTIVLHPYGRYSNAFKFAGEIDVIEAIEHVCSQLPIDKRRIAIRGFSMGGAGCWQLAVHYPNLWAAANPGAGFSETIQFLRFFQKEEFRPTEYQNKLLHWYDCPDWTNNLRNVPTVAYSGEIDNQKQAADIMEAAFRDHGMELTHIIGPKTGHKIHADSKVQIQALLDQALKDGQPVLPQSVDLTTYSLRYNRLHWLSVLGLKEHWQESRVQGRWSRNEVVLNTTGVTHLKLEFPEGSFTPQNPVQLNVDSEFLTAHCDDAGQLSVEIQLQEKAWHLRSTLQNPDGKSLQKEPGLHGPIDDAFMDSFIFVGPSRKDDSPVGKWANQEFERAKTEWIRHFRGDVRSIDASEVTEELQANNHLVLFGTPTSNPLIAEALHGINQKWQTRILWKGNKVAVGNHEASGDVAPILVYPNPKSPNRYIVLNSGFTYREYAYLNNARQIPMLPDWAIADVSAGSTTQYPAQILDAGFFDEQWKVPVSPLTNP